MRKLNKLEEDQISAQCQWL